MNWNVSNIYVEENKWSSCWTLKKIIYHLFNLMNKKLLHYIASKFFMHWKYAFLSMNFALLNKILISKMSYLKSVDLIYNYHIFTAKMQN